MLDDYRWLVGDEGRAYLERAAAHEGPELGLAKALRRALPSNRARLLIEQTVLRRRAAAKFSRAACMFFTRSALEQATDEQIAAYKAQRYRGHSQVIDLCCGIGGDLHALTAVTSCLGVDRDPVAALLARANGGPLGQPTQIVQANADLWRLSAEEVWHLDPDRRAQGRRVTRIEQYQPGFDTIQHFVRSHPTGAVKLAPATELPSHSGDVELEWIGSRGECRQQVAWWGALARSTGRTATVISRDGRTSQLSANGPAPPMRQTNCPGRFIYEPDPTVLAAHLEAELADRHGLAQFAATRGYLTGDSFVPHPLLTAFTVQEALPFDVKRVRALLRARGIAHLEIKCRGLALDPAELRRRLRSRNGSQHAVLIVAGRRGGTVAIVAQRAERTPAAHDVVAGPIGPSRGDP